MKRIIFIFLMLIITKSIFAQTSILSSTVKVLNHSNNNLELEIITSFPYGSTTICPEYFGNEQFKIDDTLRIKFLYDCTG